MDSQRLVREYAAEMQPNLRAHCRKVSLSQPFSAFLIRIIFGSFFVRHPTDVRVAKTIAFPGPDGRDYSASSFVNCVVHLVICLKRYASSL